MRMRSISGLLLIALTLLFVTVGNVFGQFDSNIIYRITTIRGDQCLTVARGMNYERDGAPVIQSGCLEGERSQQWQLLRARDYYYQIIAQHSLRALDVFGGVFSTGNGVRVDQWAYSGTENQMWRFANAGDGICQIIARHSQKPLDMNGGPSAGEGSYAQQWDNWHGPNQKFRLRPAAWKNAPMPAACPTEDDAHITLYATDRNLARRGEFSINETISLKVWNNTRASIFFNQEWRAQRLIREEGLQVERLWDTDQWFPVVAPGECPPDLTETGDGSVRTRVDDVPLRRVFELRAGMSNTRSWTAPISLGPGTYRLRLVYARTAADLRTASAVCSSAFTVR